MLLAGLNLLYVNNSILLWNNASQITKFSHTKNWLFRGFLWYYLQFSDENTEVGELSLFHSCFALFLSLFTPCPLSLTDLRSKFNLNPLRMTGIKGK